MSSDNTKITPKKKNELSRNNVIFLPRNNTSNDSSNNLKSNVVSPSSKSLTDSSNNSQEILEFPTQSDLPSLQLGQNTSEELLNEPTVSDFLDPVLGKRKKRNNSFLTNSSTSLSSSTNDNYLNLPTQSDFELAQSLESKKDGTRKKKVLLRANTVIDDPLNQKTEISTSENKQSLHTIIGKLVSLTPKSKDILLIDNFEFTIGRATSCIIQFDDAHLSTVHSKINYEKGELTVSDLSSNGTFVNKDKIGKNNSKIVKNGDTLSFLAPYSNSKSNLFAYKIQIGNVEISGEEIDPSLSVSNPRPMKKTKTVQYSEEKESS